MQRSRIQQLHRHLAFDQPLHRGFEPDRVDVGWPPVHEVARQRLAHRAARQMAQHPAPRLAGERRVQRRRERAAHRELPARAPLGEGKAIEQRERHHARVHRGGRHGVLHARAHGHGRELADALHALHEVHGGLQAVHRARLQVGPGVQRLAVADAAQVEAQAAHAARGQEVRQLHVDAARPDAVVRAHVEHQAGDGRRHALRGEGEHAHQCVAGAEAHRGLRHVIHGWLPAGG
ncbi:hypothetical protein FQZ97_603910 [compost metagenome]